MVSIWAGSYTWGIGGIREFTIWTSNADMSLYSTIDSIIIMCTEFRGIYITICNLSRISKEFCFFWLSYTNLLILVSPRKSTFLAFFTVIFGKISIIRHFETVFCLEFHWKNAFIWSKKITIFTFLTLGH